eukprot:CFRG7481T1
MRLLPKNITVAEYEKRWSHLHDLFSSIMRLDGTAKMEWISIYEEVYNLCTARPVALNDRLYQSLNEFFTQTCRAACTEILKGPLTSTYYEKWQVFSLGADIVRSQCSYLQSTWIKAEKEKYRAHMYNTANSAEVQKKCPKDLGPLAFSLWKTEVFELIKVKMVKDLLQEIERDRQGEIINTSEVQGVILSLVELDNTFAAPQKGGSVSSLSGYAGGHNSKNGQLSVYQEAFENQFLAETAEFYKRESTLCLTNNNCSEYMKKAEARLQEEEIRARKLVHLSSLDRHIHVCETELILRHKEMMKTECEKYLKYEDVDDLSRMYRLLTRVPKGIDLMLDAFQNYVSTVGRQMVAAIPELEPRSYVECLLVVHEKYLSLLKRALESDGDFIVALDKACRSIVNFKVDSKQPALAPELFAKYTDLVLKKSATNKNPNEGELLDKLQSLMTLFKYVDDKDVFQKFYSRMLAKRLIHNQSVSEEAEEKMIDNLKQMCGFEFTMKLQRMFTDVALSSTINKSFAEYVKAKNIKLGLYFSSFILQSAAWPITSPNTEFDLPGPMEKSLKYFEDFYHEKHNGRKLQWMHHVSKADIKLHYLDKRYEIQCTSYQVSVLIMFNDDTSYTYAQIAEKTKLEKNELDKTIESLTKVRIITHGKAKDVYTLNKNFESKRTKLKITSAVPIEQAKETREAYGAVQEHRVFYLQATIVRIMKSRKLLSHTDLVQEVVVQSKRHGKFTASISQVKKCIEQLIDKEYLERVGSNKDQYSYVA